MYKGFILSESLKNPTILNGYKKIYVKIEYHPETNENSFWHLFKIEINDSEIEEVVKSFAKETKYGWYGHFYDGKQVYIVFENKIFKIPQEKKWSSNEFLKAKAFAIDNGVEERYLDFWIED